MTTPVREDWCTRIFPGEGTELPQDWERDAADRLIETWNERWQENHPLIPRTHPDVSEEGFGSYLARPAHQPGISPLTAEEVVGQTLTAATATNHNTSRKEALTDVAPNQVA